MNKLLLVFLILALGACTTDEDRRRAAEETRKSLAAPQPIGTLPDGRQVWVAEHHIHSGGGSEVRYLYMLVPDVEGASISVDHRPRSGGSSVEGGGATISISQDQAIAAKIAQAEKLLREAKHLQDQQDK